MENPTIFEGKTFQQLLEDIYKNSAEKKVEIEGLMKQLAGLISKPTDAAIIVPVAADLLEVAVKNDEHLVKIATIVQRVISAKTASTGGNEIEGILTEEEKEQLYREAEKHKETLDELRMVLTDQEEDDGEELRVLTEKTKKAIEEIEAN